MASQIAHVLYTEQYLLHNPRPESKEDFMLGVLFPDIRRVSNVSRRQTHLPFEELDLNFEGLSSFEAGWKFHVWCDLRRNELLRDLAFLDIEDVQDNYYLAHYFLEDQLLWERYKNWETVANILLGSQFRPLFPELSKNDWEFWYGLVAKYIKKSPTPESVQRFCKAQPAVAGKVSEIIDGMEKLRKNKKVVEILTSLHEKTLK